MKKLNIIIPTFNSEKTIIRAIDSIFKLGKKFSIEILIIDDHSSDETLNLIQKKYLGNRNVQVLKNNRSGVSAARNTGLKYLYERSQKINLNEYVVFLDSDDILITDFFDAFIKLDDLSEYDYIAYYYQSGKKAVNLKENPDLKMTSISSSDALNKVISGFNSLNYNFNSPWGRLIKLSFLKKNHLIFDERISYKEDFLFNLEVLTNDPKICIINKIGYYHYKNPDSVINNFISSAIEDEEIVQKRVKSMKFNDRQLDIASYNSWLGLQYIYVFPKNLKIDNYKKRKERFLTVKDLFTDFSMNKFNGSYLSKECIFFVAYKFKLFGILNLIFKLRGII